jgi:hypothetical protein
VSGGRDKVLPIDAADDHRGRRRRRVMYLAEGFGDGDDFTPISELIYATEPEDPQPGGEDDPDWRPPDRRTNPYGWEMFWRWMMRRDATNLRWRADAMERVTWYCQCGCGKALQVKPGGRPPRFYSSAHRQRAYRKRRKRVTKRPR